MLMHQTLSKGWCPMLDLDSFLVSLYVLVDDWWKLEHSSEPPRAGRPALLLPTPRSSRWPSSPSSGL
jgi:hypothetical protein